MRFLNIVAGLCASLAGYGGLVEGQTTAAAGTSAAGSATAAPRPLAVLAGKRVLVLPVQEAAFRDSLGWGAQAGSAAEYLLGVDEEIGFALKERGVACMPGVAGAVGASTEASRTPDRIPASGKPADQKGCGATRWILPSEIAASAKRNGILGVDPYRMAVDQLKAGAKLDKWQLRDPLAAQVRALIALNDTRYVIVPVELRIINGKTTGEGEPRLRVVVIDGRRAQVQWIGEVVGVSRAKMSPAVAADLASRFGALIAP